MVLLWFRLGSALVSLVFALVSPWFRLVSPWFRLVSPWFRSGFGIIRGQTLRGSLEKPTLRGGTFVYVVFYLQHSGLTLLRCLPERKLAKVG